MASFDQYPSPPGTSSSPPVPQTQKHSPGILCSFLSIAMFHRFLFSSSSLPHPEKTTVYSNIWDMKRGRRGGSMEKSVCLCGRGQRDDHISHRSSRNGGFKWRGQGTREESSGTGSTLLSPRVEGKPGKESIWSLLSYVFAISKSHGTP